MLTLAVFMVRVFSRVLRSNRAQTLELAADPSLSRNLRQATQAR